jgi:flavin-binding protein dodecin
MADKVVHPTSTYDVIELIGTSSTSWEDAAKNVIAEAAKNLR